MKALDIHMMGYEDLLPLKGKAPNLKDWVNFSATLADAAEYTEKGINVGLKTTLYPAIDVDVTDEDASVRVYIALREVFGVDTPIRYGQRPKFLALTRLSKDATPIRKTKIPLVAPDGSQHAIEVLGHGQQFVILGKHPSGVDYEWTTDLCPPSDLPVFSAERFEQFKEAVKHKLELIGWQVDAGSASVDSTPQNQMKLAPDLAPNLALLRSAVEAIPNGEQVPREVFVSLAHSIKGSVSDEQDEAGYLVFADWAMRGPSGDEYEPRRIWTTINRDRLTNGWDVVRTLAERKGWDGAPAALTEAQSEFSAVEEPPDNEFPLTLADVEDHGRMAQFVQDAEQEFFTTGDSDWFVWDGVRWRPDPMKAEHTKGRIADQLVLISEHLRVKYPSESKKLKAVVKKLRSVQYINTIFSRIGMNREVYREREQVNDPQKLMYILNTPRGTYDLKRGKLTKGHNPAQFITQVTSVDPDFDAEAPEFMKFLRSSCGEDEQVVNYVLAVLGSALTTDNHNRLIWFLTGESGAGKSTLLKHMHAILGDYAGIVPQGALIHGEAQAHQSAVAGFRDKRFLHGSEIDRGHKWNVSLLKNITGNEVITARRLYHEFEEFHVVGKVIIAGNETPTLPNVDSAMRARLRVIQFQAPNDPDEDLDEKLAGEYPAILATLVRAAQVWIQTGYPHSERVAQLTEEYFSEEDLIGQFRDQHFLVTGNTEAFVTNADLFTLWCEFTTIDQRREQGIRDSRGISKAIRNSDPRLAAHMRRLEGKVARGIEGMALREEVTITSTEDLL